MINSFIAKIKKRPLLGVLIVTGLFIGFTNLRPQYSFLGWDNYSSFFNLPTNIFRTFFATWREYRGLGVPSDSEATDIFRQLFWLVLSPVISENLLDQIYYMISLNLGLIGMYFFADRLIRYYTHEDTFLRKYRDIFCFLSAFFYLFNLNTLAVFYFPMTMFVSRFFTLPILFFILLDLIYHKHISRRRYFFYIFLLFITSGSYMVPTVFVTTVMAVGIFLLFQKNIKRTFIVGLFFVLINMFWVLPFVNYTIQKSDIVRLAPTFVDGNEGFTNKSKLYLSPERQMIFYPQFFEMKFTDSENGKTIFFHTLATLFAVFPNNLSILYVFPVLYTLGGFIMLFFLRQRRQWLWIPTLMFTFLFLSMKEYSPLGFFYVFLTKLSPYFEIIFRFGDTKFHPYVVFGASISAALACIYIYDTLRHKLDRRIILSIFIVLIMFPTLYLFRDYFQGNFIGFFMYNKIPQAYRDMTNDINNDPEYFRVMHLPIDRNNYYWKPYSWGLFGSAFLNFMLDKPIFDKTFQPASMENAYIDEKITNLHANIQSLEGEPLQQRVNEFYQLVKKVGVKYIILDESVSVRVHARGVDYWGNISKTNERKMLQELERMGLVEKAKSYDIDLKEYTDAYKGMYPYRQADLRDFPESANVPLIVYRVKDFDQQVSFVPRVEKVDANLTHIMRSNIYPLAQHFVQSDTLTNETLYPFQQLNSQVSYKNKDAQITLSDLKLNAGKYTISADVSKLFSEQSFLLDLKVRREDSNLVLTVYHRYLPTVQNQEFSYKLQDITIPLSDISANMLEQQSSEDIFANTALVGQPILSNVRVRVDGTTLPLPAFIPEQETYVGSVIAHQSAFDVELLEKYESQTIPMTDFKLIENKGCYGDALKDYSSDITNSATQLSVTSQNGSVCFWRSMEGVIDTKVSYLEMQFDVEGRSSSLDKSAGYLENTIGTKPLLKNAIDAMAKPHHLKLCFKENTRDDCYNTHDIQVGEKQRVILPVYKKVDSLFNAQLFFAIRADAYQQQFTQINGMEFDKFEPIVTERVDLGTIQSIYQEVTLEQAEQLTLSFPRSVNAYSYYATIGRDSFYHPSSPCIGYRTNRVENGKVFSYLEQCENVFFIQLPFSSANFYLWQIDYNLGSGQYPYFVLEDQFNQYIYERTSLYQGYPSIKEFKTFQNPEFFTSQENVAQQLNNLEYKQAFVYSYPQSEVKDTQFKNFYIKQFSENEGLVSVRDFNIVELPNIWSNIAIKPVESELTYDVPAKPQFESILPSLWKVTVTLEGNKKHLMMFNEAYDKQWGLYTSFAQVLFGSPQGTHYKCDGYANCFEIDTNTVGTGDKTFYVFYWPERLNLLGWIITFLSIGTFAHLWARRVR